MDSKLNLIDAYRAYAVLLSDGERTDGGYLLDGLTAYTDPDGYTVTLSNEEVSARLMFHSRIQFEAPSSRSLQRFVRQVLEVANRDITRTVDDEGDRSLHLRLPASDLRDI